METGALPVELKRYEKSAPARLGKDADDIWLLLSHFFMDRTLETNLVGFLPTARRGLFRR
ncbi:MAG: hypothetical protein EGQ85_08170 [Faecalibacterium prausnitzii]|nr:hypothetical protein [Faecalibacterium prausnitzii]